MKKFILYISVIILFGCKDEKEEIIPIPEPEASFTTSIDVATLGETIEFENTSIDATRYNWDFGDGKQSFQKSPQHSYDEFGFYVIILKAYNSTGVVSEYSIGINIYPRRFKALWLVSCGKNELPAEMFFYFGEVDNPDNTFYANFPSNTTPEDLPFGGALDFGTVVTLNDNDWYWMLIKNKAPFESFDANDELIFGSIINPAWIESARENGYGIITIDKTTNNEGEDTEQFVFEIGYQLF